MKHADQQAEFYRQFGANLRRCREQRKLSQETLARMVGLTRTSLTNIEAGRQHPPLHTFSEIIEQLGAEYGALIPRRAGAPMPADLQARAKEQVRGEGELAFIKAAIGIQEGHPDDRAKEKDQNARRHAPK